jgi:hypothetical protein
VKFLASILHDQTSPLAVDALYDIRDAVDRLEHRFAASQR